MGLICARQSRSKLVTDCGEHEEQNQASDFPDEWRKRHTFGLGEVALLDTRLQSFVEHRIKLIVRGDC